jgi:hypothetical protein
MATLSSLLVQREIASMRTVEDAIARQVIHGGDLATNLLEVAVVSEAALLPVLAEATGLEAAPAGRLAAPPASALRAVPGELALRHGVFPLSRAADVLLLATSQPLPGPLEDDLSFALGIGLRQVVAPLVRIRQAIAEHYGQPLDRRFLRLIAKLEGRPDPSPSSLPPGGRAPASPSLPRPASAPPASFGSGPVPGSKYATTPGRTPRVGVATLSPAPSIPRAPAAPRVDVVSFAEPELASGGALEPAAPGAELVPPIASPAVGEALAGWAQRTARGERQRGPGRGGEGSAARLRRKGPMTAAMAENELELTSAPEAVLEVHFSFVSQFFEYAVLFVAHGDLAEGRNAAGPGADRSRVAGIGVPLDLPSILATARDRGAPMVVALAAGGLDGELARDLSRVRVAARGGMVAVIPVMVRGRAVALLYGDDGEDDVELGAIGEVIAFTALVEKALERAILRRKMGGRAPARAVAALRPPAAQRAPRGQAPREGAAALARAMLPPSFAPQPVAIAGESAPARVSPVAESVRPGAPAVPPRASPSATPEDDAPEIRIEEAWHDTLGEVEDELGDELAGLAGSGAPPDAEPAAPASPGGTVDVDADAVDDDQDDDAAAGGTSLPGTDRASPRADEDLGRAIARVVEASPPLPGRRGQEPITETWTGSPTAAAIAAAASTPPLPSIEQHRPTLRGFAPVAPDARSAQSPSPAVTSPPRRGPAPGFDRGAAGARDAGEPLPIRPPPNATSVPVGPVAQTAISFSPLPAEAAPGFDRDLSATPPPATAAAVRPRGGAPIPREESDDVSQPSPDASEILGLAEASAPQPPARTGEGGGALPSIIVDVGAEYASLLERALTGGPASDEAFAELVRSGDQVLPAIAARFPGPLRVDRHRARDQLPAASQCGPILELLVAMRRVALPLLTMRSSGADANQRFWATHALGELRYTEAANAVLPRLFDDEPSVRRVARRSAAALVSAGEPGQPILRGLEHIAGNAEEAVPRRVEAVETMGDIRAASMVPVLVEAVRDAAGDVRDAARRALLLVTRQDFDRDAERWNEWWLSNGHRHRVDWLIDALMHEVPSIRRAAGDELKQLTKEYFGYYDDLPRRERERAQARYREWWEREGRQRFQG